MYLYHYCIMRSLPNGSNYKSGTSECEKKIETHEDYSDYLKQLIKDIGFKDGEGVVISLSLLNDVQPCGK